MPNQTKTLRNDLLAAVARIRPVVEVHACEAERDRTLHPAVVAAMRAEGLFGIAAPRALGGLEVDIETQLDVFEAMAFADSSAGWCLMIGALTTALLGAYLPEPGVERVFSGRMPIGAGLHQPIGVARRRGDGFLVDGRWGFGSGIRHADWVLTAARVESEGASEGAAPMILVAVPVAEVTIESTWDAVGLRGSGSEHYRLEGVVVEAARTCAYPAAAPRRGGPIFALPFLAFVTVGHVAFALGVARRALEEIVGLAPRKVKLWTLRPVSDDGAFRDRLGRAFSALSAARAWSREVLVAMEARISVGATLGPDEFRSIRAIAAYTTEIGADVAQFAFRAAGASALDASHVLQRCVRDLNAATQHVTSSDDGYAYAGATLLDDVPPHPILMPRAPRPT